MNFQKSFIICYLLYIVVFFSSTINAQDFNVSYIQGNQYKYKPSLSQRLQGINDVVIIVPKSQSKVDQYYYACLTNYFRRLGVPVRQYQAYFSKKREKMGSLDVIWSGLDDNISDCWSDANTLIVIGNLVSSYGYYRGEEEIVQIRVIDPANDFTWDFNFEMPNKEEKFDKKLKNFISSYYSFNQKSMQINPHYKSNWNGEWKFKDYFNNNTYHPLEGVYEGDNYKVAVKKGADGKFYLVFLSGEGNPKAWSIGDIKAILEPTATPTVFKGNWYGRWKQLMDYTFIFKDGLLTIYDEEKNPETYIKLYPALLSQQEHNPTEWSGTGFALKNGYIITNYHVIEDAKSITIQGVTDNFNISYSASVIGSDKNNDLALLKINDSSFNGFGRIPYSITTTTAEVGEDIYVLGYPLTSTMGDEIKLTNGIISSKTGFQGDVSLYQISAPIQPGNSGGPLFDKKGNVIGVVSAKHAGAENVGYAIKSSYLRNLVESCASPSIIPSTNTISTLSLPEKVKKEKNFVFFIHCSLDPSKFNNTISSLNNTNSRIINNPSFKSKSDGNITINSVTITPTETILDCSSQNPLYGGWMNINPKAYLRTGGTEYKLTKTEGIKYAPDYTYFDFPNQTLNFKLYFQPIPTNSVSMDFMESLTSGWRIYGINLQP